MGTIYNFWGDTDAYNYKNLPIGDGIENSAEIVHILNASLMCIKLISKQYICMLVKILKVNIIISISL